MHGVLNQRNGRSGATTAGANQSLVRIQYQIDAKILKQSAKISSERSSKTDSTPKEEEKGSCKTESVLRTNEVERMSLSRLKPGTGYTDGVIDPARSAARRLQDDSPAQAESCPKGQVDSGLCLSQQSVTKSWKA